MWGTTVLVVAAVIFAAGGVAAPASAASGADAWASLQNGTDLDPDRVVTEVEIRPDGSAHWTVNYRVRLDNESVTEAFEAVRSDIESNRLERAGRFKLRTESVLAAAANETGREMEPQEVAVRTDRRQPPGASEEYGVIAYEFVWTNFAAKTDNGLDIGGSLPGFFLTEETTMLLTWPEGYQLVDSAPASDEPRDGTVVWRGPKEFTADGPRVLLEPTGGSTGVPVSPSPVLFAVVAVLAVVIVGGWYRRRGAEGGAETTLSDTPEPETGVNAVAESKTPPEELLSDEERLLQLLEDHGGRMKQQDAVEELEWSETKTSQVVTDLYEAEKIERYRLGRENVLALPGEMDV
jgi:uncharacterized membrane protein